MEGCYKTKLYSSLKLPKKSLVNQIATNKYIS